MKFKVRVYSQEANYIPRLYTIMFKLRVIIVIIKIKIIIVIIIIIIIIIIEIDDAPIHTSSAPT